jgi:branched-chain amino acid transport system substrate-binding protein
MKKEGWIVGVVLLVAVVALFMFNSGERDERIKVGVIAPLSGDLAVYGHSLRNGITLAQEDFDLTQYKFIFEDSEYNAMKSVSAYRKLVDVDDVDFIIGWGSVSGSSITSLATKDNIPLVFILVGADVSEEDSGNVIIPFNDPEKHIEAVLESIEYVDEPVSIFLTDNPFLNLVASGLDNFPNVKTFGKYQFSDMDFKTDLLKISDESIVVLLLGGPQVVSFYKQMTELKISPRAIIGTDMLEDVSLLEKTDSKIDGTLFPAATVVDQEFTKKYSNKFKSDTAVFVAGSYYDIFATIQDMEKSDAPEIISILKAKEISGVMGDYSVKESNGLNYMTYPLAIRRFSNETIETVELIDLG